MANDSTSGLLAGKTIVVTGVGTGLGKEVATAIFNDGANLVIGARTESQLQAVAEELDPTGERVAYVPTDIADEAACEAIVAHAIEKFGRLDGIAQIAAYEGAMGNLSASSMNRIRSRYVSNSADLSGSTISRVRAPSSTRWSSYST